MLNPVKNENGDIVDVSSGESVLHFITIGWKVASNICPPAHYLSGWPCFFIALIMIGFITYLVAEVSSFLCCVMNIKPGVLGFTLIAFGTGIPDAIASYRAAKYSKCADASIGNLLGVNTATILFGLGLPWVIAIVFYNHQ